MVNTRLIDLPSELLIHIANALPTRADVSSLLRTDKHLWCVLEHFIFQYDISCAGGAISRALLWASSGDYDDDVKLRVAQRSIDAGADVNAAIDFDSNNGDGIIGSGRVAPIAVVATTGRNRLAQLLLDNGADINLTFQTGYSAVAWAVQAGNVDMIRFFLRQPKINLSCRGIGGRRTLLGAAIESSAVDVVRCLLPEVDPNQRDASGNAPLHLAAGMGNTEIVSLLLSHEQLNPNQRGAASLTALRIAVQGQNPKIVSMLLSNKRVDAHDARPPSNNAFLRTMVSDRTVFIYACNFPSLDIVKLLHDDSRVDVDFGSDRENLAAKAALMNFQDDTVDFLLRSAKTRTARFQIFCWGCDGNYVKLVKRALRSAGKYDQNLAADYKYTASQLYNQDIYEWVCDVLD